MIVHLVYFPNITLLHFYTVTEIFMLQSHSFYVYLPLSFSSQLSLPATGQPTNSPVSLSLSGFSRTPSPPYDNLPSVDPLSFDPPAPLPSELAEDESFVDTTSTPFKTALASFNQISEPSVENRGFPALFGYTPDPSFSGKAASSENFRAPDNSFIGSVTSYGSGQRPVSVAPSNTSPQLKSATGGKKAQPTSRRDLSAPFRRSSDSSVAASPAVQSTPFQTGQGRPSSARVSAERAGPHHSSPPPPLSAPRHFVKLHEFVPASPPVQRRLLPRPSSVPSEPSVSGYHGSFPTTSERGVGNISSHPYLQYSNQTSFSPPSPNKPYQSKDVGRNFSPTRPASFPSSTASPENISGGSYFRRDSPSRKSPLKSMENYNLKVLAKRSSPAREKYFAEQVQSTSQKAFSPYGAEENQKGFQSGPSLARDKSDCFNTPFSRHSRTSSDSTVRRGVTSPEEKSSNQNSEDQDFEWPSVTCALAVWEFPNSRKTEGNLSKGDSPSGQIGLVKTGCIDRDADRRNFGSSTASFGFPPSAPDSPSKGAGYSQMSQRGSALIGPRQRGSAPVGDNTVVEYSNVDRSSIFNKGGNSALKVLFDGRPDCSSGDSGRPDVRVGTTNGAVGGPGSIKNPRNEATPGTVGKGKRSRSYQRAHTIGGVGTSGIGEHISAVRMALESSRPADDLALKKSVRRNGENLSSIV